MTITRAAFLSEARSWIDVPWVHQGRNRYGVDCIGLVLVTCWALALTDYDISGYGRTPNADMLMRELDARARRIDLASALPADLVLSRFNHDPQHVGILTARGILHAYAGARRVVETALPRSWRRRIVAAYAVPGVA